MSRAGMTLAALAMLGQGAMADMGREVRARHVRKPKEPQLKHKRDARKRQKAARKRNR